MPYPADFELDAPHKVANWRPLVHWILAIPHLIIAGALNYAANFLAVISWFSILFTGKLPEGIAKFQVMSMRYGARAYSYAGWLYEDYPPFDFEMSTHDDGLSPVKVNVEPQLTDRNRLTCALRIFWLIPIALFATVIAIAMYFVMLVSFFVVLFTGKWSDGMRSFVLRSVRLFVRVGAYANLLVDDYPPFALEEGGGGTVPAPPPVAPSPA